MNWALIRKHHRKIKYALLLNIFLAPLVWSIGIEPLFNGRRCPEDCQSCLSRKEKRYLKGIGSYIYMNFSEGGDTSYPQSPSDFEFDPELIGNGNDTSWETLSRTSEFYFFCNENSYFTGSEFTPIAISKKSHYLQNLYFVLYEDGHVETINAFDALKLMYPHLVKLYKSWNS